MKSVPACIALCAVAAVPAHAGVVGTFASARFTSASGASTESTFLVSGALTEFYYAEGNESSYGAFTMDVRASALRFKFDFAGRSLLSFGPGATMVLTFAPQIQVDSLSLGTVDAGVSGIAAPSLLRSGNVVTVDMSALQVADAGAAFVLQFTSSTIPGPASLVGVALLAVGTRRRR